MFSHITVGSKDLNLAVRFYDAVLSPLGLRRWTDTFAIDDQFVWWSASESEAPRFYVCKPFNNEAASAGNGCMVAFSASSAEIVDTAFAAGMAGGGQSEGEPGPREHYSPGYYGAYLRDPDGNKLHLVYRAD